MDFLSGEITTVYISFYGGPADGSVRPAPVGRSGLPSDKAIVKHGPTMHVYKRSHQLQMMLQAMWLYAYVGEKRETK